jgi:hypothetical protein
MQARIIAAGPAEGKQGAGLSAPARPDMHGVVVARSIPMAARSTREPQKQKQGAPKAEPASATIGGEADVLAAASRVLLSAVAEDRLDRIPSDAVQQLLAAVVRAYSGKVQAGEPLLPFDPASLPLSPTDVMITASGLLRAADLQVFELGMWQSYTGR